MKLTIVGAGPGDPELITLKGKRALEEADIVIYAGSLVNKELLSFCKDGIPILDSAGMTLEEVLAVYKERAAEKGLIVRLHTGDPALYGAIQEQIDFCLAEGMEVEVIPGVSSVFAAAAALRRELTLPDLNQTVILTRAAGRTPVPEAQSLSSLASHGATLGIFLSATLLKDVVRDLMPFYGSQCPIRLVHRASWPDQRIVAGNLGTILAQVAAEEKPMPGQVLILAGPSLDPSPNAFGRSKLYDPAFSHGRREGTAE